MKTITNNEKQLRLNTLFSLETEKSLGHICFKDMDEYFILGGNLCIADKDECIASGGYRANYTVLNTLDNLQVLCYTLSLQEISKMLPVKVIAYLRLKHK